MTRDDDNLSAAFNRNHSKFVSKKGIAFRLPIPTTFLNLQKLASTIERIVRKPALQGPQADTTDSGRHVSHLFLWRWFLLDLVMVLK